MKQSVYDFSIKTIDGQEVSLSEFRGKVLLVVNVASKCGFTPQYTGLEELHKQYASRGFQVMGFPCNQFGNQEPGNDQEIKSFCQLNYGVSFPLFSKIEVNGPNTHPLYKFLKKEKRGFLGTEKIKWNFTKFLIDREGKVVCRIAPTTKPESLISKIEKLL
ncbi:MAG: glutathione peroxidase [Bacteriovoracia bacterium]